MADPVVASRFVLLDSVIGGAAAGLVVAVAVGSSGGCAIDSGGSASGLLCVE